MTKEENLELAENLRREIYKLREKGYTFRFFYSAINCSSTTFYNFMRGYNNIRNEKLLLLQNCVLAIGSNEEKGDKHYGA